MKIVLAIERQSGQKVTEESYSQPVIRVGRDSNRCEIFFDNEKYRMVSRHHADIRFSKGKWMVGDMGSSFGTFVNGAKIERPIEISAGSSIQFGEGGPRAHVIWLEGSTAETNVEQADSRPAPIAPEPSVPSVPEHGSKHELHPSVADAPRKAHKAPRLELSGASGTGLVEVSNEEFWLGRDPHCDVVIEEMAVMVSRRHAKIRRAGNAYLLEDNQSFNGTLVNEQRISSTTPLYNNDRIRLGHGGPVLKFLSEDGVAPGAPELAGQRVFAPDQMPGVPEMPDHAGTMVFKMPPTGTSGASEESSKQLLMQIGFGDNQELLIGRNPASDITLDGLQISNRHARLRDMAGGVVVEDLNSTNGVFVNGERVSRKTIGSGDSIQIGSFVIELDDYGNICVFDTRSKTRIDAVGISKVVKNRAGAGQIRLLDNISLSVSANEFVGLLGPSGAGKSTFMDALNGMRPASSGTVYINGIDLYRFIDSLKQSIGHVPQDEVLHSGLTVSKTLYYIAKLRLSQDVSRTEIDQTINEVLDVTGLTERRDVSIKDLSGGQRKRVSIAVELITKPSAIYLDEPTSGLDPATEEKIMQLFRQIAESGRTVILTTHAMENVRLFDKIVVLMRGKLVFYGKPAEALSYFRAGSFKGLYDKLEEPVKKELAESSDGRRFSIIEKVAEEWKQKFEKTDEYQRNVQEPLAEISDSGFSRSRKSNRLGIFGAVRQWLTLTRRYSRVLFDDKFNLFILFAQAPVIAILVFFVMGSDQPRDFVYFALSLCAIWFGTSVAAREIVRERKIYERERMVNLGILPFLVSKYTVLGAIVALQCLILFIPLKIFDLSGSMPMPGLLAGIPQFVAMLLTAAVGIALGLFVSAIVRTSEMATSLIPLILIPQIIFSGLIGLPTGINKVVGLTMPATWSFDTMKRLSTLDTLEQEGALPNGETDGKGLYKSVEEENDRIIADAKQNIRSYEKDLEKRLQDAERRAENGERVKFTGLPERPKVQSAEKLPKDLSPYITFLHPWMHEYLNPIVLLIMFMTLFIATVIVLRIQDMM